MNIVWYGQDPVMPWGGEGRGGRKGRSYMGGVKEEEDRSERERGERVG